MRLILVGCEYAGKTTLVQEIVKWRNEVMGPPTPLGIVEYHDHFTLPSVGHWNQVSEEDLKKFMELGPVLKEMFQRYQFSYHLSETLYRDSDNILVGFHIEDAVYAPRYYGYGRKGEYGDRAGMAHSIEAEIREKAYDTVLIHVKASPEIITQRMRTSPHERTVLREEDIAEVLEEFEYHFSHTLLRYRMTLDTTKATVEETMKQFVEQIEPLLTSADRLRIQARLALRKGA